MWARDMSSASPVSIRRSANTLALHCLLDLETDRSYSTANHSKEISMAHSRILLVGIVHLFLFVFALSANAQLTSRYTNIGEKSCRAIKLTKADEGVISHRRCKGVAGYQLDIFSGEEHEYIDVRTPSGKNF